MITVKELTDIDTLLLWRKEVIEHVFGISPDNDLLDANRRYYESSIASGTHQAFLACIDGEPCGCGGICYSMELPSPDNPSGRCGYIMNIYVREKFRKHGIAHIVVKQLIKEAQTRGCGKIYLETTADGKPVYESLGFHKMPDMMKFSL